MSYEQKPLLGQDSAFAEQLPLRGDGRPSAFMYGPRPTQDKGWAYAFYVFVAFVVGGGIYSIVARNPMVFSTFDPEFTRDPHNCPAPHWDLTGRSRRSTDMSIDYPPIVKTVMIALVASILISVLLGFFTLWFARAHPRAMVFGTIWTNVITLALFGVAMWMSVGLAGAALLGLALLTAVLILWGRESLEICASLMKVAGRGLSHNLPLIWMSALLECIKTVLAIGVIALVFFALQNGHVAPNPSAHYEASRHACYAMTQHGHKVPAACCVWVASPWAGAYTVLALFFLIWMMVLFYQIRLFTVSGTVAHWYFSPNELRTSSMGRVNSNLKNALGPQFGSVCESSVVLTVVQMLRQEAQDQQNQNNGGCQTFLACILVCLADIIEKLTNFTTITMSITGKSFVESASLTFDLLQRNMLSTVTVWWLPGAVVSFFTMGVSLLLSVASGWASYGHIRGAIHIDDVKQAHDLAVVLACFLGVFVFAFSLSILMFFCGILLNTIDTIFICFAMDCDTRQQTRPEVFEAYSKVPSVAKAVEEGCWMPPPPPYEPPRAR